MIRGYVINISAIAAVSLAMYFPGLDIVLALVYLYVVLQEGKYSQVILGSRSRRGLVAVIWQLPGFLLAASILCSLDAITQFGYYFIFMLELWDTPVLPLISLLPAWTVYDRPVYYYLLFAIVPVLSFYYYSPSLFQKRHKSKSAGSI